MSSTPKVVFIVPYRDRDQQLQFFHRHMSYVLEEMRPNDCAVHFVHQQDDRSFNRGAIKNIGFLFVKSKYPDSYQNITLVFNDIDTMPYTKNFLNYQTIHGKIKHFYGFTFALGGIVSITAGDFEKLNGFPNFWGWGYEDNLLNKRALANGFIIDRSQFYDIADKNIMHFHNGVLQNVNHQDNYRYVNNTPEGLNSIQNLQYSVEPLSITKNAVEFSIINVTKFSTGLEENKQFTKSIDLRVIGNSFAKRISKKMSMNYF